MLVIRGITYRIDRTQPHCYAVVRLLDDVEVGTFRTRPSLRLEPSQVDVALLSEIVKAARRSARTSAAMHVAPPYEGEGDRESSPSVLPDPAPPQAAHPTSSAPPPALAPV
jgi:hypothetical protein